MEFLPVKQVQDHIEVLKQDIKKAESEVRTYSEKIGKLAAKGELTEISSANHRLTRALKHLEDLKGYIKMANRELTKSLRNEAGYGVVVEFLEELLKKDIAWHKELKADFAEKGYKAYIEMLNKKKITKAELAFAQMSEEDALKTFHQDLEVRYQRLVMKIEETVGKVVEISLRRNPNSSFDGTVTGDQGSATITTVIAGGFNIQRAHYRTLTKKVG